MYLPKAPNQYCHMFWIFVSKKLRYSTLNLDLPAIKCQNAAESKKNIKLWDCSIKDFVAIRYGSCIDGVPDHDGGRRK